MKNFDYIKSPDDRLYLELQDLIKQLCTIVSVNGNIEAYAYLRTIQSKINTDTQYYYIKQTEEHILDVFFLEHRCFTDIDKKKMIPIIREYKLDRLVNY